MKIELTDDEWTTVLVALDNYSSTKDTDWQDSGCEDDELRAESSGAEWLWQKICGAQQEFRNSIADAVGEGEQP
jgi:hypothetical protein